MSKMKLEQKIKKALNSYPKLETETEEELWRNGFHFGFEQGYKLAQKEICERRTGLCYSRGQNERRVR